MDNIAIIGMGCLYPSYVNKENFWEKIMNGETFTSDYNFNGRVIERGRIIREDSDAFFLKYFSEEEYAELSRMGEIFKWTAYICYESLKESGYLGDLESLSRTGIIMGHFGVPTVEFTPFFEPLVCVSTEQSMKTVLGKGDLNFQLSRTDSYDPRDLITDTEASNYVMEKYSLGGPVMNLNSACSSIVYAMKVAIMYLLQGKADMMLAGSTCHNQSEESGSEMLNLLGILTEPGDCRPFDKASKGTTGGSGAGMFMLKRLEDAIRDKDPILGVIESIGWSNDGGDASILAPASSGQILSYKDAYRDEISPDIDYLECHATGTMAGDWVEIDSIDKYFKKQDIDLSLGALKANTSHFFTASTHAAIAKVFLSMKNGVIPQTIRIENPLDKRVLTENTPWQQKGPVKRAAINSFGFGGADSHVVVREYDPSYEAKNRTKRKALKPVSKMAVVGLGANLGDMKTSQGYFSSALENREAVKLPEKIRWTFGQNDPDLRERLGIQKVPKGSYIFDFDFDFLKFKLPALGDDHLLRKDFLLLNTAEEALNDAGISRGSHPNTAVLLNCKQDYSELNFSETMTLHDDMVESIRRSWPGLTDVQVDEIMRIMYESQSIRETPNSVSGMMPNIKASRIAAHWGFHGPAFALTNGETGFIGSLELAQYLLSEDIVDTVVVGTVELNGEIENLFAQIILGNMENIYEHGVSEGAAVTVLKKLERAEKDGDHIYSTVDGVALSRISYGANLTERLQHSMESALNAADVKQGGIGYVEMPRIASPSASAAVTGLLKNKFQKYTSGDDCISDSVENYLGMGFGLTGAAAFVKNVMQLAYGVKFAESEDSVSLWHGGKSVLINSFDPNGAGAHAILSEYTGDQRISSKMKTDKFFIPVFASGEKAMSAKLDALAESISSQKLQSIYTDAWDGFKKRGKNDRVLCLIADNKESLKEEVKYAAGQVAEMFSSDILWESEKGSCCAPGSFEGAEAVCILPRSGPVNKSAFYAVLSRFPDLRRTHLEYLDGISADTMDDALRLSSVKTGLDIVTQKLHLNADILGAKILGADGNAAKEMTQDQRTEALNGAWKRGARVFIDLSTGACDIDQYAGLEGREYLAVSLYSSETSPEDHFMGILAKLVSCGIYSSDLLDLFALDIHDKPRFVRNISLNMIRYVESISSKATENWERVLKLGAPEQDGVAPEEVVPSETPAPEAVAAETESNIKMVTPEKKEQSIPVNESKPVPATRSVSAPTVTATETPGAKATAGIVSGPPSSKKLLAKTVRHAMTNRARAYRLYLESEKGLLDTFAKGIASESALPLPHARPGVVIGTTVENRGALPVKSGLPVKAEDVVLSRPTVKKEVSPQKESDYKLPDDINWNAAEAWQIAETLPEKPKKRECLWDLDDIIEMTKGSMAKVLGPRYKSVDTYPVRARLPLPPFLFIDRITKINAEYGKMAKGSSIEIEYDITRDCSLMIGDHISFIALTESAQIGIFLMAYIGIDDMSQGTLRFRVADSSVIIHDRLPLLGETFRGAYEITSIFKAGTTTLVTASFKGYVGDMHMMTISTIGGFFTEDDLSGSKGVVNKPEEKKAMAPPPPDAMGLIYDNPKTSYNDAELMAFYTGDFKKYIPDLIPELMEKLKTVPPLIPKTQLVHRILKLTNTGGKFGLGEIIAEFDIDESHWAFDVHFLNDPVFPASLMMEGVNQLTILHLVHSGKISRAKPGRSYPRKNKVIKTSFRGQVERKKATITYNLQIKEIRDTPEEFYTMYDVDIYVDGVNVVRSENASICLD